ncbi:MAG: hypothetical protein M1308_01735, partial [Actinobacteria bacterium]|nr:hypothetical protein [Actinomycetota bacterium]
ADVTFMKFALEIKFSINPIAIYITLVLFFILFLINSLHGYRIIYRFKLIELFRAQKEGEKIPKTSYIITALSVLVIIACYILSLKLPLQLAIMISPFIICAVVLGTYGLFHNIIALYIKSIRKNKRIYYNKMNLISFSQILYRIKSNATVLATIAVLAATTISAAGTTYALYKADYEIAKRVAPFSYSFLSGNQDLNNKVESILKNYPELKVTSKDDVKIVVAALSDNLKDPSYKKELFIISESQYNQIAGHQDNGNKKISIINENDCFYIPDSFSNIIGDKVENKAMFAVGSQKYNYNIAGRINHSIFNSNFGNQVLVIKDENFNDIIKDNNPKILSMRGYMLDDAENSKELTKELASVIPQEQKFSSFYDIYSYIYNFSGPLLFIGLFLGVLFFLATGSIIYFKQLIEAGENKNKYITLREIGVSKNEIRQSVSKQQLIIFGLPLIAGISHSAIVLSVFQKMLWHNIFQYCLFIIMVYIACYIFFYFITVNSYTKIVTRK